MNATDQHHDHHHHQTTSDGGLVVAIILNGLLTVVEIGAGLWSGSLALIADAIHNGSDAGSMVVALVARRLSRRMPDSRHPFGYRRASIIGAFINVVTLLVVGVMLISEAIARIANPPSLDGPIMMAVAGVALVVDLATVFMMYRMGTELNIRAALAHNLSDAMASLAVILAGIAVWAADLRWVDQLLTVAISVFVILQGLRMIRPVIRILMDSTPEHIDLHQLSCLIRSQPRVVDVYRLRLRSLDEDTVVLDAQVAIRASDLHLMLPTGVAIKAAIHHTFQVSDTTIEWVIALEESMAIANPVGDESHA